MSTNREFQSLFAAALDAVVVIDDARVVIEANPAACRLLALPLEALVGRRFDGFLMDAVDLETAWTAFLTERTHAGELHLVRDDATVLDVEYSAAADVVAGRHLAILRDVTERKRIEAERAALLSQEQARLRETETLLAVSRALCATLDPVETMRRVAREIAHAVGADMVGAYLADRAQEQLCPVAGYRVPKAMIDAFRTFPIPITHHPAIEQAWSTGAAVWTDDMAADPRVDAASYSRFAHQSDVFLPIRIKGRPVGGFFLIWWTERRVLSEEQLRVLSGISDLAGLFLDNAQLYREVAEANRGKDEFLAMLSHELRNPLAAITNAVAALDRLGSREPPVVRLRHIVQRQTQHLTRLVDDLLDVARVTAGKIALTRQPLDLADVTASAVRALRERRGGAAHQLTFRAEPVVVSADPTRLDQIITNLLENAVKYTRTGGSIDVDVTRDGDAALLRVTDTGVGIEPAMLPRIFDMFAQAAQPLDRSRGGLGIGLALTRRLVELHGGSIRAFSAGLGTGATFTVRLPLATAVAPTPSPVPPTPGRGRRILVIEDNDDARESLRLLLESLGHDVLEARSGQEGIGVALDAEPDVVLIDLGLPGVDGYEVARTLRAKFSQRRMTLIAVTGYGHADDRQRSKDAGCEAHLVKPVSVAVLSTVIAGLQQ